MLIANVGGMKSKRIARDELSTCPKVGTGNEATK